MAGVAGKEINDLCLVEDIMSFISNRRKVKNVMDLHSERNECTWKQGAEKQMESRIRTFLEELFEEFEDHCVHKGIKAA